MVNPIVEFLADYMRKLDVAIKDASPDAWKIYNITLHQVAQAHPSDLRDFVLKYGSSTEFPVKLTGGPA